MIDKQSLLATGLEADLVNLLIEIIRSVTEGETRLRAIAAQVAVSNNLSQQIDAAIAASEDLNATIEGASTEAAQQVAAQLGDIRDAAQGFAGAANTSAANAAAAAASVEMPGGAADRGDSHVLARINQQSVAAFDLLGRLVAVLAPETVSAVVDGMTADQADDVARKSQYIVELMPGGVLDRGDQATIIRMGGAIVLSVLQSGHLDLRLADAALADVRTRLALDELVALSAPLAADLAGDFDAWDVWQRDGLTFFTANLWGDTPRGYVRRAAGEAWAVAPSITPLKLVYGDHVANAVTSVTPDRYAHIATLGDGADQDGLDGAVPTGPAADLARAGAGFGALSADRALAERSGALARYGVRSEAVEGATLDDLMAGQPLANLVRARSEFVRLSALYGGTVATESVTVLHSGGAATAISYRDDLIALATTLGEDIEAGQVNVIPPGGTWASGTDPAILGAVEALRSRGAAPLVLVSPVHWCGVLAGTLSTPDPVSMTMLAELDALATRTGTGWHGPVPYLASRTGNVIVVDCEVMDGADMVAPTYGVS